TGFEHCGNLSLTIICRHLRMNSFRQIKANSPSSDTLRRRALLLKALASACSARSADLLLIELAHSPGAQDFGFLRGAHCLFELGVGLAFDAAFALVPVAVAHRFAADEAEVRVRSGLLGPGKQSLLGRRHG